MVEICSMDTTPSGFSIIVLELLGSDWKAKVICGVPNYVFISKCILVVVVCLLK